MASPDAGVLNSFNTAHTGSVFIDGVATEVSGSEPIETSTYLADGETFFTWPGSNVTTMHGSPTTYITGIELFDEHGECLATARTSKPIKKAFDREVFIKVKLTF